MQGKHLFEYAVIRVVPHVEREEFLNVGVVMYCGPLKFLKTRFDVDDQRLRTLCSKLDFSELKDHISSFEKICSGNGGGPIGKLSLPERFRWLTATRSTMLQTSKVHPGFCEDPDVKLAKLYDELVQPV
jgi:hypothetical protein